MVVQFIAACVRKTETEKGVLIMINVDETQTFFRGADSAHNKDTFAYQLIEHLFSATWESRKNDIYIINVLSGTNALSLYKQFLNSGKKYEPVDISLLSAKHYRAILWKISGIQVTRWFARFLWILLSGHPRLLKAFISIASTYESTLSLIVASDNNFDPNGFKKFLLRHQHDTAVLWSIAERTATAVSTSQFPEVSSSLSNGNFPFLPLIFCSN